MSRRIIPPLTQGEIKVREGHSAETHPQEFGKPGLLPSCANLSQAETKDVFFVSYQELERTSDGMVHRELWLKPRHSTHGDP